MEQSSIFMEHGVTKPLFNKLLSETNNNYKLEKLQKQYMESKEIKLCNNYPPRIKTKNNLFWMDGSSSMEWKKKKYKKVILLGFITSESLNCKALRTKLFEGEYYDMTPSGGIYVVKCILYDPKGGHIWG